MIHRWFNRFTAQPLPATEWRAAQARVALLATLNEADAERLGQRAWHFLNHKRITLHADLRDTPFDLAAQLVLAGQACLLTLGWTEAEHLEAFTNVHEILILPDGFSRQMEEVDETGVIHLYNDTLAGETSYQGPVILSFTDLMKSGGFTGSNVLIHELAHKLDMGNSIDTDGFPPLPREISPSEWHRVFSSVWNDLTARLARGEVTPIDDYAASHPGECYAVCCELFFSDPVTLNDAYPELYELLCRYFNQQPLKRFTDKESPH
ncbi:zinc-dependent peptidase [Halomonas sp. NPDC076908]|uniref:M90 family metallopeptidase n=1 Tax=Halomonas sp. NPDC076908 TaxID=3390567 RepID=UPI003CFF6BD7